MSTFTNKAKLLLSKAEGLAITNANQQLTVEHLLLTLLSDPHDHCAMLVEQSGGHLKNILKELSDGLDNLPKIDAPGAQNPLPTATFRKLISAVKKTSKKWGNGTIASEDLLFSIATETSSSASTILERNGLSTNELAAKIEKLRSGTQKNDPIVEANHEALAKYTQDLTQDASDGKLDPVIGRDEEIRRTIQVISRRTKNNPVLIGEPGVGKTAIAESLALRIINGDIPEGLKGKRLLGLDLGLLIAGAKFRGEFEERLKSVINAINSSNGEIILFIDELHTLVGAGAVDGTLDASNMLKPALARGTLRCVGATTLDEYRKHIEKDAALARRFQPIQVDEPKIQDSISILRGLKEKYELHHGVRILDNALVAAVNLSTRYISDRFLPDKAIDLIDEAASARRMEIDSKPECLDELDRKIVQLRIEQEALKKEANNDNRSRLKSLESELSVTQNEANKLTDRWLSERETVDNIRTLQENLDNARRELEAAQRTSDYEKAGEFLYSIIPDLEQQLQSLEETPDQRMVKEEVTAEEIAAIVSRWTGIPTSKMITEEEEKLLKMEFELGKRVIGQAVAVSAVANAVRRSRVGLQDPKKPIGSFLFLGPTGVGKTEMSKAAAEFLFDNEESIVRIDMSEFMEKHSVARLIGAPPGYVGFEDGGFLTERIRRRPYQVILFDEIEKAHPEVLNLLLQLLDEGRLTDGNGRTVDFSNTLIILTSNLGSESASSDYELEENDPLGKTMMNSIREYLRPEFINRLDEIIVFSKLNKENMARIVDLQIIQLQNLLSNKGIKIVLDKAAKDWLSTAGYDPIYGARPLKRVIQSNLYNSLATRILEGRIQNEDTISVTVENGSLSIKEFVSHGL